MTRRAEQGVRSGSRGSTVVDTALWMSFVMVLILGGMQLFVFGSSQITADATAYTDARLRSINTTNPDTVAKATFMNSIGTAVVQSTPLPSSFASASPVNYNYTASTSRVGGVTTLGSDYTESYATKGGGMTLNVFGATMPLYSGGAMTEPLPLERGTAYNAAGDVNPNASFNHATGYFGSREDSPPISVPVALVYRCTTFNATSPGTACTSHTVASLGIASYLDADNWGRTNEGGVFNPNYRTSFWEVAYHQQIYAKLGAQLQADASAIAGSTSAAAATAMATSAATTLSKTTTNSSYYMPTIYGWDATYASGSPSTLPAANPGNGGPL